MEGWIKLHRSIQENWIWQDLKLSRWWIIVLLNVNYKPKEFSVGDEKFTCNPGQSFRSIIEWTMLFGCSKKTTVKFFKMLQKDNMISIEILGNGNRRKHLLTVEKWEEYQQMETEIYTGRKPKTTPEGNPNVTPNKKEKKEKKEKINNILLSQVDESTLDHEIKQYYQIALSFWTLIKSNLEELNISITEIDRAKFETWVKPIELLMRIDGRTKEEFREVWKFIRDDDFWKEQIRSTAKLRKKNKDGITYFEMLLIKSRNEQQRKQKRESTERNKQSGVGDDYRQSILERLRNPKGAETIKEN
jgi:hypothetical protein